LLQLAAAYKSMQPQGSAIGDRGGTNLKNKEMVQITKFQLFVLSI
jgi:hypothetical protein